MAKCIRCGKSTLIRGHVKLFDAAICTPCFISLGFKLTDTAGAYLYSYDEIKDGKDKVSRNIARAKAEQNRRAEVWKKENPEEAAAFASFMEALNESAEDPDEDFEDDQEE